MQFNKLRLSGFKSFVETTELAIEPGMTGVVGPNGCGKSNLVEALRWAMGETSPKQMRGSEMEDVIFGGTAQRPARNIAEVTLKLDNRKRTAPAAFNDSDELEVIRRIERGMGSAYRINGQDVRARDVQTMFADAATGARSTALVSQGRIGAIINARPTDRRHLIDEAAGITGLYARRHEAELRLRAAETNLTRVQDVLQTLEEQLKQLKKQARQASRYRNLSDHIRRAEAQLLALKLAAGEREREEAAEKLRVAEAAVADLTRLAGIAATTQADAAAVLPELRQNEAAAAAKLQRLNVAAETLDAEERRVEAAQEEGRTRLLQIEADAGRERERLSDAQAAIADLEQEKAQALEAQALEAAQREQAQAALDAARADVAAAESALEELTGRIARDAAMQEAVLREIEELGERLQRLGERHRAVDAQKTAVEAEIAALPALADAEAAMAQAGQALEEAQRMAEQAEADRSRSEREAAAAQARVQDAATLLARLRAEAGALAELLAANGGDLWPKLIDAISVTPGYELALGAALGEDLQASGDAGAPVFWRALPATHEAGALPGDAVPLARFVQGPAELDRRLARIGVVGDHAMGDALQAWLAPGQMLVSRDGAVWRWDGFTVKAGAPTAAATRLAQRNRLNDLRGEVEIAETEWAEIERQYNAIRDGLQRTQASAQAARQAVRGAEAALSEKRQAHARLQQQANAAASRLQALLEQIGRLNQETGQAQGRLDEREAERAAFVDLDALRAQAAEDRQRAAALRGTQIERQGAHERLLREIAARAQRLQQVAIERGNWQSRADQSARQIEELDQRRQTVEAQLAELDARPAQIAEQREKLLTAIGEAETERSAAADALAAAEAKLSDADKALKQVEGELAQARETRVRREAQVEQAEEHHVAVIERIRERLRCEPEQVLEVAGVDSLEGLPEIEKAEQRVERLVHERETMGAVNLRAEEEAGEMEQQIGAMTAERDDLVEAIARLRQGIAGLNREGRERFVAAFEQVDRHFQELFTKLFGGGKAQLKLTESEDPLEAGLEIMASPPGKKLQVMSLLSGGEQALTALALLFAVFMTNPAPICVLDEVDAPLDDANVERFCNLVEEISHKAETRFLIITHHRVTMAKMHRLFGVTMTERGVSQLVSVDLQEADRIVNAA
ncbi:MAG: chromosome segregation protein SMC [Reyranellaceae bacterium]